MSSKFKKGDRVRDKFKSPKPGDECVTGTIVSGPSADGSVTVKWDAPNEVVAIPQTRVTNVGLLEWIDE